MQLIHCDGCNKTEPVSTPDEDKDILPFSLTKTKSLRSWERNTNQLEAELCSVCLKNMLFKYFCIPSDEEELDIPAFMSTVPADVA